MDDEQKLAIRLVNRTEGSKQTELTKSLIKKWNNRSSEGRQTVVCTWCVGCIHLAFRALSVLTTLITRKPVKEVCTSFVQHCMTELTLCFCLCVSQTGVYLKTVQQALTGQTGSEVALPHEYILTRKQTGNGRGTTHSGPRNVCGPHRRKPARLPTEFNTSHSHVNTNNTMLVFLGTGCTPT